MMSFDGSRLSHAYIASGGVVDTLAMAAVCSGSGLRPCMECAHCKKSSRGIHPDIMVISKMDKKREILIEQVRELKKDVIVVPNEAAKKAYIINDAETMNDNAQNAFLRILEEPPSHAVFILKTDTPADLLPTVRSRCVELKTRIEDTPPEAAIASISNEFFSAIRQGGVPLIEFMFRLEKLDKEQLSQFLTAARMQAAAELRMAGSEGKSGKRNVESWELLSCAERVLAKAEEYLELNVNAGHISGLICATLLPSP